MLSQKLKLFIFSLLMEHKIDQIRQILLITLYYIQTLGAGQQKNDIYIKEPIFSTTDTYYKRLPKGHEPIFWFALPTDQLLICLLQKQSTSIRYLCVVVVNIITLSLCWGQFKINLLFKMSKNSYVTSGEKLPSALMILNIDKINSKNVKTKHNFANKTLWSLFVPNIGK